MTRIKNIIKVVFDRHKFNVGYTAWCLAAAACFISLGYFLAAGILTGFAALAVHASVKSERDRTARLARIAAIEAEAEQWVEARRVRTEDAEARMVELDLAVERARKEFNDFVQRRRAAEQS